MRFIVLLSLFPLSIASFSQEASSHLPSRFLSSGVGWGGQGMALDLQFSYELKNSWMLSAGVHSTFANDTKTHQKETTAWFLTAGTTFKGRHQLFFWGIGPSIVTVDYSEPGFYFPVHTSAKTVAGVHVLGGIFLAGRIAGVGLMPYLDLNTEYTIGGATLQVLLGRVLAKTE